MTIPSRTTRPVMFALLAVLLFAPITQAAEQPPNIVLIISDDQAWTDYGFMGHEAIETPHLDKLARQSVVFRRGYVPTALCRPSLTTLATGLYAHQSLITGNDPARTSQNQRHATESGKDPRELLISNVDKNPTVPRILAEHGYLSFQCGKWWEGSFRRGGFTHGMTRGYPERGGRHGDDGLKIGREGMQPINDFIDTAVEAEKPFFLWYAPFLPHTPHNPPERLLNKYLKEGRPKPIATYYAMCEWFDETCGQLLDRLDAKGIADNTLVVYVTDNGWIQRPNSGGYAARSKRSPYEGGVRTPIMFRWPGKMKPAERTELCSSIDIMPTILAAAGAEIPERLSGLNLLPQLQQATPIERDTIFGETFAHDIADIRNPEASLLFRWVIRGNDKLLLTYDGRFGRMVYPPTDARPQLFDLKNDPHEKVNRAAKQPELVKELSGLLDEWYPLTERKSGIPPSTTRTPPGKKPQQPMPRKPTAPKPAAGTRPNILFFFTDDQRNDTLGCAGHPIIKTPTIDRLAEQGVRFSNMFVSHSICWVSRASILTGLTARSFGEPRQPDRVTSEAAANLYPGLLRRIGYRTAHFGKFHAKMPRDYDRSEHFDEYVRVFRGPYFKKMPDGSTRHETEIIADHAVEFLKSQPKDRPFAVNLWFNASHAEDGDKRPGIGHFPWPKSVDGMYDDVDVPAPRLSDPTIFASQPEYLKTSINRARFFWRWDTPEKYQTNIRAYFRMISGIDRAMARVLKTLEAEGLAENTIIVYSADNGYYMGDRGFAGKWSHYEQSLRVPLIIHDPRPTADGGRGRVVDRFAMNLDLPATFLAWAGVDVPTSYQGRDLSGLVTGKTPESWRQDMFFEHVVLRPKLSWEGIRDERFKYARYFDQETDSEFLHDLAADPDELKNLATDPRFAVTLAEMRQRTDRLVGQYGGPLPNSKTTRK